ncbi:MAG: FAD-binding oxidoreductase [Promethearchaeia archaeon]
MKSRFKWKEFISVMKSKGFREFSSLSASQQPKNKGNILLIGEKLHGGAIRDPSHLHISPYILFRPLTEDQLKEIVVHSQALKIPLTFCSGKTGLSGGYVNFGIVVDLEDLHSFPEPFTINVEKKELIAEQSALISDLIKGVLYQSEKTLIFPIQPASALTLPVRVGGMIASNASGVTSGKLGAVKEWIKQMRVMTPKGKIIEISQDDPLFHKIVGGNGYYGIILSAVFQLYKPPERLTQAVLFGENINSAFSGLQSILDNQLSLQVSEFVMSPNILTEKFNALAKSSDLVQKVKWSALIQGKDEKVNEFIRLMEERTELGTVRLNEAQFKVYLDERAKMALLSFSGKETKDYLKVPGCEDILAKPKDLPQIIRSMNLIFQKHGFKPIMYGYGHINFRKGEGLLLHARLPVPVRYFYKESKEKHMELIAKTLYELIHHLKSEYHIKQKAEHSPGPFEIWLEPLSRESLSKAIKIGEAFVNPHLIFFNEISKKYKNLKDIYVHLMKLYLN